MLACWVGQLGWGSGAAAGWCRARHCCRGGSRAGSPSEAQLAHHHIALHAFWEVPLCQAVKVGSLLSVTSRVRRLSQTRAGQGGSCSIELPAWWVPHLPQVPCAVLVDVGKVTRGRIDRVCDEVGQEGTQTDVPLAVP